MAGGGGWTRDLESRASYLRDVDRRLKHTFCSLSISLRRHWTVSCRARENAASGKRALSTRQQRRRTSCESISSVSLLTLLSSSFICFWLRFTSSRSWIKVGWRLASFSR